MKMKRPISILLAVVLLAGANAVLARDGGHRGSNVAGRHSGHAGGGALTSTRPGTVARPTTSVAPGYQGVRPAGRPGWQGVRPAGRPGWQGVRPIVSVHPQPGIVVRNHRHHPHRGRVFFGSTVIIGAPFFYPAPVYVEPAPVYAEPPVYVEQGAEVYYFCSDYQKYYPEVTTCPSPWLRVRPDGSLYPD